MDLRPWSQAFVSKSMGIGLLFEPFDQTRSVDRCGCSPVEPFGYIEIVESAGMAYYMSHFCTQRLLNRFEWFIT